MATTTTRTLSSSYVPRNRDGSRPASPALSSSYVPRASRASPSPAPGGMGTPSARASSSLRHEVKEQPIEREVKILDEETMQSARDILELLSALPVPISDILGAKSLKKPIKPSPTDRSFTDYVHRLSGPKKRGMKVREELGEGELVGLGLSIEPRNGNRGPKYKRQRTSLPDPKRSPELARTTSRPGTSTPSFQSRRPSANRRESAGNASDPNAKERWSRDRWNETSNMWNTQAILAKRYGDAMTGGQKARAEFLKIVQHNPVAGYAYLIDSVLLFLYSYWCTEQAIGRVRADPYLQCQPLIESTRKTWEVEMRRAEVPEVQSEMNKGMVGLLCLIEALCNQQINIGQSREMHARQREFSANPSSNPSTTPTSSTHPHPHSGATAGQGAHAGASGPLNVPNTASTSANGHGRSPAASGSGSRTSHSPPDQQTGPSPMSSASSETFHTELLPLIGSITDSASKAAQFLQASRFYLSTHALRDHFPKTYESAMTSDFSGEALPVPGDMLGSGRTVDPDRLDHFAWPIELGMSAAIPNLVTFGRSMVNEYAEKHGFKFDRRLNPPS